jgi:TolB-like protein/Tfp pilus assembly protein PilF
MSAESSRAVFLSYASQDAEAAQRICAALRAAGVEVWFDQNELTGGDAWDAKIRKQIAECALFVPLISANTQARREGYFRLEWRIAAQRTHMMSESIAFLLPVVIDATRDAEADVPAEFKAVQWTRLRQDSGGQAPDDASEKFCARVKRLLGEEELAGAIQPVNSESTASKARAAPKAGRRVPAAAWAAAIVALTGVVFIALRPTAKEPALPVQAVTVATPPALASGPAIPVSTSAAVVADKSVAVLAFANLSDDKANEYFSDGISEELIGALGRVPGLTVKGSTSAFYFKHKEEQFSSAEIARQLGVTYLVRGSVRKDGDKVRITAQLTRAATDELVWASEPLTREVKDVWSVQEEVARLIAQNLSLKLGVSSSVTTASVNPEAYQLYLAARQAFNLSTPAGHNRAEELLSRALKLEPGLARAHAALSDVRRNQTQTAGTAGAFSQRNSPATLSILSPAQQAVSLDPDLPEAHEALGAAYWMAWRIEEAKRELGQAIALNPNYAAGHHMMARALLTDGRMDEALLEFRRAVELDPIFSRLVDNYSSALLNAGRPEEALAYADRALVLQPENKQALGFKAIALAMLGRGAEGVALARTLELDSTYATYAAFVFALAGERAAAERVLARGPLTKSDARTLAALGRYDDCIAVLQAGALTANGVEFIYFFPSFDPIRHDPRFQKALAASGATEAHDRAQAWRAAHSPKELKAKK